MAGPASLPSDVLREGETAWASGRTRLTRSGPGAGHFRFAQVVAGVVLRPLPGHQAAYGGDRRRLLPLRPGQGWLFPAGIEGWCSWDGPNHFLNVELDAALLADAGCGDPGALRPQGGEIDPLVAQLALNLHAVGDEAPALYRDSLGMALAAQVARLAGGAPPAPRLVDGRIDRALDFIEDHLDRDIGLDEIAAAAAMSRFHFLRRFREAVGMPPHRYLVGRRIERAKALLRTTRLPVAEIAWRVGYQHPGKFAEQFRKATGATPGAWRE